MGDAIRQVMAGVSGDQQRRIETALDLLGDELLDRSPGPPSAKPAGRRGAQESADELAGLRGPSSVPGGIGARAERLPRSPMNEPLTAFPRATMLAIMMAGRYRPGRHRHHNGFLQHVFATSPWLGAIVVALVVLVGLVLATASGPALSVPPPRGPPVPRCALTRDAGGVRGFRGGLHCTQGGAHVGPQPVQPGSDDPRCPVGCNRGGCSQVVCAGSLGETLPDPATAPREWIDLIPPRRGRVDGVTAVIQDHPRERAGPVA